MWKDITSGLPGVIVIVALGITFVWIVATLVAVAVPSHPVPASVNAVMGGMVTALFSASMLTAYVNLRKKDS